MLDGWVKLWRKSLGSGILQNHRLWAFWCWCLLQATHKPKTQIVGRQSVKLGPGQFVFGRKKAAAALGLSERKVRTCLAQLQSLECLSVKTTNKYSVATIVKWELYQSNDFQTTSSRPADCHQNTGSAASKNPEETQDSQGFSENEAQEAASMRPTNDQQMTSRWSGKRPADDQAQQRFSGNGDQQMTSRWPESGPLEATNKKRRIQEEKKEEEESSPPSSWNFSSSQNTVPVREIARFWNDSMKEHCSALPRLTKISRDTARYRHVRARWKEHPDLETWRELFFRVARSSFLNGGNHRGWSASFDWIIKKDNFLKALEGNYDEKDGTNGKKELF